MSLMRRLLLPVVTGVFTFVLTTSAMAAPAEWQRVDVTLHAEQSGGMLLVSGELPDKASLPAEAELSIPAGSEVNWIGQILGGDPSADPELQYKMSTEDGVDVYRFTLTESRIAQLEVPITTEIGFDGTNYNAALAWTSSQDVPEVNMSVKIPAGSQIVRQAADASVAPAEDGYSYYAKTVSNVEAGQQLDLSFAYSAAAPAGAASVPNAPSATVGPLVIAFLIVAAIAVVFVVVSRRKTVTESSDAPSAGRISPGLVIVLIVAALFVGVLFAKGASTSQGTTSAGGAVQPATAPVAGDSPTSNHNDATADYEAALALGKPIYVLFHSLTCDPCVAISAVADDVLPDYEGEVTFVNAISDDASAQQLASKFSFQYIPTSFFLKADGTVVDSFTGEMDETKMRGYLDALVAD